MSSKERRKKTLRSLDEIENDFIENGDLTPEESEAAKHRATAEAEVLKALQESLALQITSYMAKEGIGFNELTRRLGVSPRHTSKLMKGEGNFTLTSVAEIAALMGKSARIFFEDRQ